MLSDLSLSLKGPDNVVFMHFPLLFQPCRSIFIWATIFSQNWKLWHWTNFNIFLPRFNYKWNFFVGEPHSFSLCLNSFKLGFFFNYSNSLFPCYFTLNVSREQYIQDYNPGNRKLIRPHGFCILFSTVFLATRHIKNIISYISLTCTLK